MAASLPQEILSLIASHITGKEENLTPYTLVNKSWQAAFERNIYSSLVVLSPSDIDSVRVGPTERRKKHGLSLSRLDDITSGLQDWRRARRTYIRKITYRVAVPYWLDSTRVKDDDYSYDNKWRSENDSAFSQGMRALFDRLSTWTNKSISLDIALQSELAYVDDDHYEPNTLPVGDGLDDEMAPYCADFLPGWYLPTATCVASLDFPEIDFFVMTTDQHYPTGT